MIESLTQIKKGLGVFKMNIDRYEELGIVVFKLKGRVDSDGALLLKQTLEEAVQAGQHKLVLVMKDVNYINSAGLRVLADIVTRNKEQGGDLRLVGLNERVRRVFEIIGFLQFFSVYDQVLDALNWAE